MVRLVLTIALFGCSLLVAGCGGGSDVASGPSSTAHISPAAPVSPTPAPSPAPAPTPPSAPSASVGPIPCPVTTGRTLEVGPGKTYTTPSAASAVAQNGDRILITPGDYVGDVTTWSASNLVICGDGGRARLFANNKNAQGKGTWVLSVPSTATTTILNVEFHQAKVPDQNGAGIRLDGGNLVLRNTGFYDNENGILGGEGNTTVTIDRSEFARNGFGDGFTHNIYIGNITRLNVSASYFHEAKIGHNLKSRAKETFIENSYFADGSTGTSSYLIDTPNGGVVFLRGNLLHKGPKADNSIAIAFGAEGLTWTANTLTMVHNTVVSTYPGGAFVSAPTATQQVSLTGNLFAGTNGPTLVAGGLTGSKLAQQSNLVTVASNVPGAVDGNFWPVSALLPQQQLSQILDPQYAYDAPRPYTLRPIPASSNSLIGALQSQP
jgi:hypothetical protein